ncbi:Sec-independent protein translocase subunit TatA/TatB [Hymenobacter aerophilus]|uniref:Sec-independent protein translocase subunit TatA/TatB n=1 Tax=Hymenobacter aerophilus TaxID=119644 RepID=UPI000A039DCE|nr:twin-arginine translocase TatA/TatE family subunit [Hymenobacter aerophilus]
MQTPVFLFLGDLGGGELMLIMVVILIFFGANKIPELARGLGKGIREFKDASREIRSEVENYGQPAQQPYQQQFQPQQQGYQPAPPVAEAAPVLAPPMDGGIAPVVTPEPTAAAEPEPERPRLDQLS